MGLPMQRVIQAGMQAGELLLYGSSRNVQNTAVELRISGRTTTIDMLSLIEVCRELEYFHTSGVPRMLKYCYCLNSCVVVLITCNSQEYSCYMAL